MSTRQDGAEVLRRLRSRMARLNVMVEAGTSAAMSYFDWAAKRGDSAEAAMLAWGDELLVYFRSASPTASAVLEEYAHCVQERKARFSELPIGEMQARREHEVHACLDEHGERLDLPLEERRKTRELLEHDRALLAQFEELQ